jgi:hypothetical protein
MIQEVYRLAKYINILGAGQPLPRSGNSSRRSLHPTKLQTSLFPIDKGKVITNHAPLMRGSSTFKPRLTLSLEEGFT